MNFIKIILLFLVAISLYVLRPTPNLLSQTLTLQASQANVYKSITNSQFPRMYSLKQGSTLEKKWNGELILQEILEWEPPLKLALERKNSTTFSQYFVFYEINPIENNESQLKITYKWELHPGFIQRFKNIIFLKPELDSELKGEILGLTKEWNKN